MSQSAGFRKQSAVVSPAVPRAGRPDRSARQGEVAMPLMGSFFGWIVVGAVAGIVAGPLMPVRAPGSAAVAILVGIAGALLGGHLAQALGWPVAEGWESHGAAAAGAILLLALYRLVVARRMR